MPAQVKTLKPPRGLSRFLFRLPIAMYRLGLGGLLGKRFVRLDHVGRRSGILRHVVLEVVRYDRESGACVVAVGFGKRSDWFLNVTENPRIGFTVGRTFRKGTAVRLSDQEAGFELVRYEKEHPLAWKELSHFMGYQLDGTREDTLALGKLVPMFILQPDEN